MLNMLPEIIEELTATVNRVTIDKVSVIDNGGNNGGGVGKFINQLPTAVLTLAETIENATGINILKQMQDSIGTGEHKDKPVGIRPPGTPPKTAVHTPIAPKEDQHQDEKKEKPFIPPDLPKFP